MDNTSNISKDDVLNNIKKNLDKNKELSHEFNEIIYKEVREQVNKIEVEKSGKSR